MKNVTLAGQFLVAMPALESSVFTKTLTYVCEHNEQGAVGLIVNRPIDLSLTSMLMQIGIPCKDSSTGEAPILFGGPVQIDCGFVLHHPLGKWQSTLVVSNDVGLTTSVDILQAIANTDGPKKILITLGYAGWAPGQLEHELTQNTWLTIPASSEIMFDLPVNERLPAALQLLGINFSNLSHEVGHA